MISELFQIAKDYAEFENTVRPWIQKRCSPHCAVCETVCCRPEYCRESFESPFLALVRATDHFQPSYTAGQGWLTSRGCALACGRPPVCYQFNCRKITAALPDERQRYLLKVLSNLVPHAGKRALGCVHIVEIMDAARLGQLKISRFRKRLNEARQAFQIIRHFKGNSQLPISSLAVLSKIAPAARLPFPPKKREGQFTRNS